MKQILTTVLLLLAGLLLQGQPGVVIDRTVAMVGGKVVLLSDVETQYLQLTMQGYSGDETRCSVLEELLFQKLMLNQADLDSIIIGDDEVELQLERRISYFVQQFGGDPKKMEAFYGKTINEIKEEFRDLLRDQLKIEKVRQGILEDVKVSPSEVAELFNSLPSDSLPLIDSKYELAHIVRIPKVAAEEEDKARRKIEGFRDRIVNGEDFAVIAALYSEDPGSASKGGELGMFGRGVMAPEFEAAAFGLKNKGDVSPIIKTEFGYHILKLIERRGDYVNVSHILITPKISPIDLYNASLKLDTVLNLIKSDSLTFAKATLLYSEDDTRLNKGIIVNQNTGDARFSAEEIDPSLFFAIENLEPGQITKVISYTTPKGQKAYRIVMLVERSKPHKLNLIEDYDLIQQYALRQKQEKVVEEWIAEKAASTYVKILDASFQDCSFNSKWINQRERPKQ